MYVMSWMFLAGHIMMMAHKIFDINDNTIFPEPIKWLKNKNTYCIQDFWYFLVGHVINIQVSSEACKPYDCITYLEQLFKNDIFY